MVYLDKVASAKKDSPRRTVIYGTQGIGKTTWACKWPMPLVMPIEDGLDGIDVDAFPLVTHFRDAGLILEEFTSVKHDYKTLVIDSADWLEKLIWKFICARHDKESITDFAYGKGYGEATSCLARYLEYLDRCKAKGIHVVFTAHASVQRFEDPEGDTFDRYQPKLHRDASALLCEWADEVLFANYKTFTRKSDEGFGRERAIGTGTGERVIYTQERPAYKASNRLSLPPEIPLDFDAYKQFLSNGSVSKKEKTNG